VLLVQVSDVRPVPHSRNKRGIASFISLRIIPSPDRGRARDRVQPYCTRININRLGKDRLILKMIHYLIIDLFKNGSILSLLPESSLLNINRKTNPYFEAKIIKILQKINNKSLIKVIPVKACPVPVTGRESRIYFYQPG
jgi:hypothetical protein